MRNNYSICATIKIGIKHNSTATWMLVRPEVINRREYWDYDLLISYTDRPANILVELGHSIFREETNLLCPEGESKQFFQSVVLHILKFTASQTRRHWETMNMVFTELSPSSEPASSLASQEFSTFYLTLRLIAMFRRALHRSLSWARSTQTITFIIFL